MKREFQQYLSEIEISEPLKSKLWEKYELLEGVIKIEDIQDVFLSEHRDEEGNQSYLLFIAFTKDFMIRSYFDTDSISIHKIKDNISFARISDYNYDLKKADSNSKVIITFRRNSVQRAGSLHASGLNCDYAISIFKKYFLANMMA